MTARTERRTPCAMSPPNEDMKPKPPTRERALAQALRANLRRRKAGERPASAKTPAAKSAEAD